MSGSAPSIPNLLSLRGTRGGPRSRGGRGPRRPGLSDDHAIQGTDDDAAVSRLSAVHLGYLDDPFAQHFVQANAYESQRRLPIINRGTYTRTRALDQLIDSFLSGARPSESDASSQAPERQIISLGAGTDTRIFRLLSRQSGPALIYHELDFPESVRKKSSIVRGNSGLQGIIGHPVIEDCGSWSCRPPVGGEYYCHAIDLRDPLPKDINASPLKGLKLDVPTLLISECCLCYLEPTLAGVVVDWFAARIPSLSAILYEPIQPDDSFGRMMISNLAQRRIRLPTLTTYPTPDHEKRRLLDAGFAEAGALTVREIWDTWFPPSEKERVDGLEGLDELEEWHMLADHYVVAWGWRTESARLQA
ncbi:leucine carboxyl methyltransferase [Plectosphaerella plurivora]|uniref:Leucine carboxyl methyltransferase 1 n=1 Tax=Plectosphaerella plurivora TaxID=936078 RepID=A0A9P9AAZ8_9PEZI|nr:leucine carboxyl methyltransferase [Plectosphaerella plurivora]